MRKRKDGTGSKQHEIVNDDDTNKKKPTIKKRRLAHEVSQESNVEKVAKESSILHIGRNPSCKPVACSTPLQASSPAKSDGNKQPIKGEDLQQDSRPGTSNSSICGISPTKSVVDQHGSPKPKVKTSAKGKPLKDGAKPHSSPRGKEVEIKNIEGDANEETESSRVVRSSSRAMRSSATTPQPPEEPCVVQPDHQSPGKTKGRPLRKAINTEEDLAVTGDSSTTDVSADHKIGGRRKKVLVQPAECEKTQQPGTEEIATATEATTTSKPRGRPRRAAGNLPRAAEKMSATELPNTSKTRGRPKKAIGTDVSSHENLSQPVIEESGTMEVPSASKTRGRPKRARSPSVEDSLPPSSDIVEKPSGSTTRGRPKKIIEAVEDRLQPDFVEEDAAQSSNFSKTRGRRNKKAEQSIEDDGSLQSQELSQSRRSGRARKKKESFDDIVARKEEELRLKKLVRSEQSSPDKTRSNMVTPSVSMASISDESAFSIPASPSSSITRSRTACGLTTSTSESLPSSSKKRKKENAPSTPSADQVKVMFTQLADNKLAAMVKKLGGKVVEKPTDCTVLVTDKVKRTVKFLCTLGLGKPIVSPNWISKSKAFSQFTDPYESLLKDKEGEEKFGFELSSSLEKAKSERLLEGYSLYVTPSVLPPPKEMKPIIECSGGTYLGKPPAKWGPKSAVISDPKDKTTWPKLTKNGVAPPILSAEAVLAGILRQRFDLETHRLK